MKITPRRPEHRFVAPLFDGPVDVVGDVHGEIEALERLIAALGYDAAGAHPGGRRLVFVGDLCDRGPDSVAVVARVAELVHRGRAQCVLGNHELSVLRGAPKEGNGWIMMPDHDREAGAFHASRAAAPDERRAIVAFFGTLPLVLERADLRVVHACWDDAAIGTLRGVESKDVLEAFAVFQAQTKRVLAAGGVLEVREAERARYRTELFDPHASLPFLPGTAECDERQQMGSPIRILTSGVERRTATPFFSGGKWRMVERVPWWTSYAAPTPVIFGHYWRWPAFVDRAPSGRGGNDLFAGVAPDQWLGPRQNAYCADFSVGRRYVERERGIAPGTGTRLGAVRWPERELRFEDGARYPLR